MSEPLFDARIEGVRLAWDEDEQVFKFTAIDPRGTLLVKDCHFCCHDLPIECWLGEKGGLRFGGPVGG